MTNIHKFSLSQHGYSTFDMPAKGRIIHVHDQNGYPTIWVEFDNQVTVKERRTFFVAFTGEDHRVSRLTYCGTAHCGDLVCHVYEQSQP